MTTYGNKCHYFFVDEGRIPENNSQPPPKASITFWELHNSYGRPILKDFNLWKHEQKDKVDNNVSNLIQF